MFSTFVEMGLLEPRHLDDMLLLLDEERPDWSFLCSGKEVHGPLALAAVDPAVLHLDLDHCPPDRWHAGVNMCSDMLAAVRAGLQNEHQYAEVYHGCNVPDLAYLWHS